MLEVTIFALFNSLFPMPKRKEELQGMMPVDGEAIRKRGERRVVETEEEERSRDCPTIWHNVARTEGRRKKQKNKEIADYQTLRNGRREERAEGTDRQKK
ncbi:hypothetical protein AVEN_135029-1 [Araneus ventricosus]|uniref:Uncharacterized protein n=1 Tax=Araneus ventricosus TaxID=182803 RepID=A0A4Y2VYV9_ARAVE|nr:hypothetical protein AVEN_135029-1 [Araneus ventricosus]